MQAERGGSDDEALDPGRTAVLAAVTIAASYWLFYDNRMPASGNFPLDIAAVRREAGRLPGPGPVRIETEMLAHRRVPQIAMVAGTDWGKVDIAQLSHRLVWPNASLIIDTGFDEATARQFEVAHYDHGAWQRITGAIEQANAIVVTHEHSDHLGGLVAHPRLATVLPRALLNPEQVGDSPYIRPLRWPANARDGYRPLRYQSLRVIAPGVVLIRAPGHTPGSQMIYVRRADGREFLFMGDVASLADNVRLERIRSRLVTDYITHEDRSAVMRQTQALHTLAARYPDLVLVPGHDAEAVKRMQRLGLLTSGFH